MPFGLLLVANIGRHVDDLLANKKYRFLNNFYKMVFLFIWLLSACVQCRFQHAVFVMIFYWSYFTKYWMISFSEIIIGAKKRAKMFICYNKNLNFLYFLYFPRGCRKLRQWSFTPFWYRVFRKYKWILDQKSFLLQIKEQLNN